MNWPLLQNSLLVAGTTTVLAVVFGLITALWLATLRSTWRNVFLALSIVALALPPFLVTNCWIDLLGETGLWRSWLPLKIYSLNGTIWILSLLLWPITTLATLSAWRRLEAAQLECDPKLTGFALFRWLLLPGARGELTLAAVLTFVLALNNFAVPAILQTKVLPDEMWVRFNTQFDATGALHLSIPLIVIPIMLLLWALRNPINWPRVQGSVSSEVFSQHLGKAWQTVNGASAMVLLLLSVGLPLAQIGFSSRTWVELGGAIEASVGTIANSFWFAAVTATLVVGLAMLIQCRGAEKQKTETSMSRLMSFLSTATWLLFFIPGVLIGIALIKIFNRPVLVTLYQSVGIILLALTIRYFALGWTAARHAIASADRELIDAAKLEGASGWTLFRLALWPQIAPQAFATWYVTYLLCLWEVETIVVIQPPGGETLALKIFNLLHYGHAGQVNALCLTLLALAVLPLLLAAAFVRARQFLTTRSAIEISRALTSAATIGLVAILVGCSPSEPEDSIPLKSKLFSKAVVIGSRGVGIGEFNKPRSVTCDTNGNSYAVDMTGRVQKFSPEGKYLRHWQIPETDLGKPKGMGCDHAGNILVVEPHYQRINHFTPDGKLVAQWGCKGTNAGCFMLPRGIAENSHGEFLVTEYMGAERVQKFQVSRFESTPAPSTPKLPAHQVSTTNWPYVKLDQPLTAQDQGNAGSEAGAPDAGAQLLQVIGRAGTGPGEFNRAEGVCVDAQDRIYVADSCNHRIEVFNPDGTFLREFGQAGSGLGQLSYPYDVAVDKAGNIFVCEFGNSRIQVFDSNCQPVEIIGGAGYEPGRFNNPWSIALDPRGNLYVADALNHRLQKLVRRQETVLNLEIRKSGTTSETVSSQHSNFPNRFTAGS